MKRSRQSIASSSRFSRDFKATSDDDSPRKSLRKADPDEQEMGNSNLIYVMEPEYEDEVVGELEEEHVEFNEEEMDTSLQVPDFKGELAKLVKKSDCPSAFTDNLLNLLRKNGHAELPTDTKSLVTEPPPLKLSDNSALSKILENQKIILKNQSFMMEQLNALHRSHATQRIRLAGLSERMDKVFPIDVPKSTNILPLKTPEEFLEFDANLTQEPFRVKVFPEIARAMQNSTWLFAIINDDVLFHYNLNGNFNKRALRSTHLFKIIEQNFPGSEFLQERHIQALIKQGHGRQNTKNSRLRDKMRKSELKGEVITDDYQQYDEQNDS